MPLVLLTTFQVLSTGDADGLDDFDLWYDVGNECPPQVVDHHGTLIAVKLHVAQMIVAHGGDNVLRHVVDEDADEFWYCCLTPLYSLTPMYSLTPLPLSEGEGSSYFVKRGLGLR